MESLPDVGGKNASLGHLIKAGIRVPPGFAATVKAYTDFITQAGTAEKIYRALSGVDLQDVASVKKVGQEISTMIHKVPVPSGVAEAISENYQDLGRECDRTDPPVAVRSSATAEDLPGASFAGQHETFLWVRGVEDVLEKLKRCISSLFTPRAISYRVKMGFPHDKVLISVGIQMMVNSRVAGVMFTLNPENGDRSKIFLEANWGLGETVVGGMVTPDSYLVDKVAFEILRRNPACKTTECVIDPDTEKVVFCDIPKERQNILCLNDEEVLELARLGKYIERHYGTPQDIEWGIDKGIPFPNNVFILQSRPETVWSSKARKEPIFKPRNSVSKMLLDQLKEGRELK